MKTTRQTILDYLERNQICSTQEISLALSMTPANARHHLSTLLRQGVVKLAGRQPTTQRGRPTMLYTLAAKANQHNLDQLASALLNELLEGLPPEQKLTVFRHIARRISDASAADTTPMTQRLYSAINRLNQMHYQSRWEARAGGPRLILGHCPYAAVLQDHPELCQMDAYLIESLSGKPVIQIEKLAQDSRGTRFCIFAFPKP
jgi:predicted ArsR family transcriptional regulator